MQDMCQNNFMTSWRNSRKIRGSLEDFFFFFTIFLYVIFQIWVNFPALRGMVATQTPQITGIIFSPGNKQIIIKIPGDVGGNGVIL